MFRGFYNATSAILTQTRRLDVISQNMANGSTAGYKEDTYHHIAFEDHMVEIIGNTHETPATAELGGTHFKIVSSEITTNFDQGVLEETTLPLDFAIIGDGFFAVEWDWEVSPYNTPLPEGEAAQYHYQVAGESEYDEDGNRIYETETVIGYTRGGSFSVDNEGYLYLANFGYVLDPDYNRIQIGTDHVTADSEGNLFHELTEEQLGTLGIFRFEDNSLLERDPRGLFMSPEEPEATTDVEIKHGYVERSNSTLIDQMTLMMTTQRALQAAASVAKMYDTIMTKATTEIGRL